MPYDKCVATTGLSESSQLTLENPAYLSEQLITYLGNKRALLDFVGQGIEMVKRRLGRTRLVCFDAFSGSGVVARFLKQHSSLLIVNDLEEYARIMNECHLTNQSAFPVADWIQTKAVFDQQVQTQGLKTGFISELYAPSDDAAIQSGERAFYTTRNAQFIDTVRQYIATIEPALQPHFLAPLLAEASVHANTAGVFKGFYKDSNTGKGCFGGRKGDALSRIKGDIELKLPVLSRFECDYQVLCGDANTVCTQLPELDLAYLDPPYNQHPYGSNYFMLNLIARYERPGPVSLVSGIPADWKRSRYNQVRQACAALVELLDSLNARFVLISFNSEGFISMEQMLHALNSRGKVTMLQTRYNTYRGSRNLRARSPHVSEYLYLLEKN